MYLSLSSRTQSIFLRMSGKLQRLSIWLQVSGFKVLALAAQPFRRGARVPLMLGQPSQFLQRYFDQPNLTLVKIKPSPSELIHPEYQTNLRDWDADAVVTCERDSLEWNKAKEKLGVLWRRWKRSNGASSDLRLFALRHQRRLIHFGSLLSYISSHSAVLNLPSSLFNPAVSHRNDVRSCEDLQTKKEAKTREMENKKLEDYLHPALLSVVSSKIGRRQRKDVNPTKKQKREIEKFQWPVDEFKVFVDDSRIVKTMDWSSDEIIDLKDDNGID